MNHDDKTKHNIDTEEYLHQENPTYMDWEVTVIFYTALHLVIIFKKPHQGTNYA